MSEGVAPEVKPEGEDVRWAVLNKGSMTFMLGPYGKSCFEKKESAEEVRDTMAVSDKATLVRVTEE